MTAGGGRALRRLGAVLGAAAVALLTFSAPTWASATPSGTQADPVVVRLVAGQAEPALVLAGIALCLSTAAVVVVLSRPRAV